MWLMMFAYEDLIVQVTLLKILDDSFLVNLRQEDHVVDTACLDIVRLPVVHLQ